MSGSGSGTRSVPDGDDDGATLEGVQASGLLVDLLAARAPLPDADDELAHLLAGWARVVDAESDAATARRDRLARRAPHVSLDTIATDTRVVPVAPRTARRPVPWRGLSAGAAAVIAVLAVGLGAQDATRLLPGTTVAESVQSIEATLTAARLAAEDGDVVGARLLLDRARGLVDQLPAQEQDRFEVVLGATEQGVASAEQAVRRGEPLPEWPAGPGRLPGDAPVPTGPTVTTAPSVPGATGTPGEAGTPGAAEAEPGTQGGTPTGTPARVPTPTGTTQVVPPVPAPPAVPGPTTRPTQAPTTRPTPAPTSRPTQAPTARPTQAPTARPTQAPTTRPSRAPTDRPTQAPTRTQGGGPPEQPTTTVDPAPVAPGARPGEGADQAPGGGSTRRTAEAPGAP